MAAYGRFEVLRELYPGRAGSVLLAKSEGGDKQIVIKTFSPPRTVIGRTAADRQVEAFLTRAKIQQKLGELGESAWAPVLESGRLEGEAYYATTFYPRSCQTLIDGQVRVQPAALRTLILEVARGLNQVRGTGRPHGNLKPSNVLIDSPDRLHQAGMFLTDPADDEHAKESGERGDLEALGHLIHQLVVGPDAAEAEEWSGAPGKGWAKLEGSAAAWRDLCRRLIFGNDETLTVESLPAAVLKIGVARAMPKGVLIAAVVVAVIVGAVVFRKVRSKSTNKQFDQQLVAYQERYKLVAKPVESCQAIVKVLRPDIWLSYTAVAPPERLSISGKDDELKAASDELDALESAEKKPWVLHDSLAGHEKQFGEFPETQKVFTRILAELDRRDPCKNQFNIAPELSADASEWSGKAKVADDNAITLLAQLRKLSGMGITYADSAVGQYFASTLNNGNDVAVAVDRVKGFVEKVEKLQPADDLSWQHAFQNGLNASWGGLAPGADPVDPGNKELDDAPLTAIDPRVALTLELKAKKDRLAAGNGSADQQNQISLIESKLKPIALPLPWNVETIAQIQDSCKQGNDALAKILPNSSGGVDTNINTNTNSTGKTPVIESGVASMDKALGPAVDSNGIPIRIPASRKELWNLKWTAFKADATQPRAGAALENAIGKMETFVNSSGPDFGTGDRDMKWADSLPQNDALRAALKAVAEKEFANRLKAIAYTAPPAAIEVAKSRAAFGAVQLLQKCENFQKDLDRGAPSTAVKLTLSYLQTDAYYDDAPGKHPDPDVVLAVNALLPVRETGEALKLSALPDLTAQLNSDHGTVDPAVNLIAWRLLGQFPQWPGSPDDRKLEQRTYQSLNAKFGPVKDIADELRKGEVDRAQRYAVAAAALDAGGPKSTSELLATRAWFEQLKIAPADIKPAVQFDFALAELKSDMQSTQNAAAAQKLGDDFYNQFKDSFTDDVKPLTPVAPLAPVGNAAGPPVAHWKGHPNFSGSVRTVRFFRDSGDPVSLNFVNLKSTSTYMLTTEVSVALANEILNDTSANTGWTAFNKEVSASSDSIGENSRGISTWSPVGKPAITQFGPHTPADRWYNHHSAPQIFPMIDNLGQLPKDPPINYIPAVAAQVIARQLNCRLPTDAEWQLACEMDGRKGAALQRSRIKPGDPDDNLRDSTWLDAAKKANADASAVQAIPDGGGNYYLQCPQLMNDVFGLPKSPGVGVPDAELADARVNLRNDKTAFFRDVNEGGSGLFSDLVGNVAEFVTDVPDGVKFGVIGGSALSPGSTPVGTVAWIPGKPSKGGYSDVGFRLVYDVKTDPATAVNVTDLKTKVNGMVFRTP